MCLTIVMVLGICLTYNADRIEKLYGAEACDCDNCTDYTLTFYECFHFGMEPPSVCSPTTCLISNYYYPGCPEFFFGADCPTASASVKIKADQEWRDEAPAECGGTVDFGEVTLTEEGACTNREWTTGRCAVGSCGGALITSKQLGYGWYCFVQPPA